MTEKDAAKSKLATGGIRGYDALYSNVNAAISLASNIRTTYGPRGRDKLLCDEEGNITVTNGFYPSPTHSLHSSQMALLY